MAYSINDTPLRNWGFRAGFIGSFDGSYALKGIWDLPKRLGETYRDWEGNIEPYVDADDILIDGRDLSIPIIGSATSKTELYRKIEDFKANLPNNFTLSHPKLGSFNVGLKGISVSTSADRWACLTLNLREPNPSIGAIMPDKDNGPFGIDGYSFRQLGFINTTFEGVQNLTDWQEMAVTKSPMQDAWMPGYRQVKTITLKGSITADSYENFNTRVRRLQTLIYSEGTRNINHGNGSSINAFCTEGFVIDVQRSNNKHFGLLTCKMIVL